MGVVQSVEARGSRGLSWSPAVIGAVVRQGEGMQIPLGRVAASAALLTAGCKGEVALGLLAAGGVAFAVSRLWRSPVYRKPVEKMSRGDIRALVEHLVYHDSPHPKAVTAFADLVKERPEFLSPPDVISPGERPRLAQVLFTAWEEEHRTTRKISLMVGSAILFVVGLMPVEEQVTWTERVTRFVYGRIAQTEGSAFFVQVPPEARNDLADILLERAEDKGREMTDRMWFLRTLAYLWPHLTEGVRTKWFPDVAALEGEFSLAVKEIRSMTPGCEC